MRQNPADRIKNDFPEIVAIRQRAIESREKRLKQEISSRPILRTLPMPTPLARDLDIKRKYLPIVNIQERIIPGGLVTVILSGGLGNRIFQIFAGLGYAKMYQKKFVLCKSLYHAPIKEHEANTDVMISKIFPGIEYVNNFQKYSIANEYSHFNYNKLEYFNGNVLLKGYFQVEQYSLELEKIPTIRTAYYDDTYFIHIRLGDYIGFHGMDFDLTKYHRRCFDILGPHPKYIVFSNENDKADIYMKKFNVSYTISDKTDALEALIEMANCAGGICANSTFSWMGGFFQRQPRKKLFVPSKWAPSLDSKDKNYKIFPSWARAIDI